MYRLPSLQSIKIFHCVARLSSFTKAADELGVSQGAISQHIKNLEVRVGFNVLQRNGRSISTTAAGEALLQATHQGLGLIQQTIEIERRKLQDSELVISVLPGFAIRWLIPRLMDFYQRFPTIELSVNTVASPMDFELFHAHAAIGYGPIEEQQGAQRLFTEHLFPVCSPAFAKQYQLAPPLKRQQLDVLKPLALLGDQSPTPKHYVDTWRYWSEQVALTLPDERVRRHTQSNISLQMAELGHGIAIGRSSLVMDALARKQLLSLCDLPVQNPCCYFLTTNPQLPPHASLEVFKSWLYSQCQSIEQFDIAHQRSS